MDTRDFGEVASRLRRALGLVNWNIADIPRMPTSLRPTPEEEGEMLRHLEGIVGLSPQLLELVGARGTEAPAKVRRPNKRTPVLTAPEKLLKTKSIAQLVGRLDLAHYFVEKCPKDLPRLRPDVRPTPEQDAEIKAKLLSLVDRSGVLRHLVPGLRAPPRA